VQRRPDGWYALVGLPLTLAPGEYSVDAASGAEGTSKRVTLGFRLQPKDYPVQHVAIRDRRKVTPAPEDLARIAREQQVIDAVKRSWRAEADVDLDFAAPSNGPLSSRFGLRRVFNGEPRAPHGGLDLAVPSGTPVRAAGAGLVTNVGDYFFNGRTVFVDHGQGLITMYCHLSRIDVREGEPVARGQPIGLSGATGRASGPHLHWTVLLNGTAVDPELFLPDAATTPGEAQGLRQATVRPGGPAD
jgi:murein DD-endopeptidase MepM/ murein hydrolase activator NlpD